MYVILDISVEAVIGYKCYNCDKKFDEDVDAGDEQPPKRVTDELPKRRNVTDSADDLDIPAFLRNRDDF